MYALETRVVDGVVQPMFVKYRYTIETFEMERITIDHVSSLKAATESESACTSLLRLVLQVCYPVCYLCGLWQNIALV